jgi:hypothetical protein
MNKEQLRELVKAHFNLTDNIQSEEITSAKFDEATLVDGTKVSNQASDAFAVGQTLYVITEESEVVVAPEGAHVTDSGIEIVVDSQGVITEVNHPDQESMEDMPTEEEMAEEVEAEDVVIEEVAMEDGDVKEAIIAAIAEAVMPEIEALKAKYAEIEEKMKEHMSKPAATPTLQSKFEKINSVKTNETSKSFDAREAQLSNVLAQFKKKK